MQRRWDAMTLEEQDAERAKRSAQASAQWRTQFPERAAIRDLMLAELEPGPCDRCGGEDDVRLFVTSYERREHLWRCKACAKIAKADHRAEHAMAPNPLPAGHDEVTP